MLFRSVFGRSCHPCAERTGAPRTRASATGGKQSMTCDIGFIGTFRAVHESVLQPQNRSVVWKAGNKAEARGSAAFGEKGGWQAPWLRVGTANSSNMIFLHRLSRNQDGQKSSRYPYRRISSYFGRIFNKTNHYSIAIKRLAPLPFRIESIDYSEITDFPPQAKIRPGQE